MNRTGLNAPPLSDAGFVLLWLFVFCLPAEKAFSIGGLGSIGKVSGLLAILAGVASVLVAGVVRLPHAGHLLMVGFAIWSAITTGWTWSVENTSSRMVTYFSMVAICLVIWQFTHNEQRIHRLLEAYVVGTFVPVVETVRRFQSGTETYYQRFALEGFDPNELALTLALSLPMAYYLSLRSEGALAWLYRIQMVGVAGTIFLTASRGGVVSMAVALLIVPLTFRLATGAQKAMILAGGGLGAVAAAMFVPASSWSRIATLGSEVSKGTLNSRTLLWKSGWTAFGEVPIVGVGSGAYPVRLEEWFGRPQGFTPVAHNTFLSVLVETGLIGFLIFGGLIAFLIYLCFQMPRLPWALWLCTLGCWAIGVSALTWENRKPTWVIFALILSHAAALMNAPSAAHPAHSLEEEYA